MENQIEIKYLLLEQKVRLINSFFNIISDGYNPVILELSKYFNSEEGEDRMLIKSAHNSLFEDGSWDGKEEVINLKYRLEELAEWNFIHLKSFTEAPGIFRSNFHESKLKKIVTELNDDIVDFSKIWSEKIYDYYINHGDGSESHHILMIGKKESVLIDFGNYIH